MNKNSAENAENPKNDCSDIVSDETAKTSDASENTSEIKQSDQDEKNIQFTEIINSLQKQVSEEKDKYLRIAAEYDNFRKRSVQDRLTAVSNAQIDVITEILSVIDNFERALDTACSDENYKKGIEMIFKQYSDILVKLGVKEIDALNKPFDPNFHHAVNQVVDENFGDTLFAAFSERVMFSEIRL